MSRQDWYRKTSWTLEDELDFETRVKRARKWTRHQYMRIQASCLIKQRDPTLIPVALALLDRAFAEADLGLFVSLIYSERAQCFEVLGDYGMALHWYRESDEYERIHPNSDCGARMEFGWLAMRQGLTSVYDEAIARLDARPRDTPFPFEHYKQHAIRAIVADFKDQTDLARVEARLALEQARLEHTGLRYHPTLCLVPRERDAIREKLEQLAGE